MDGLLKKADPLADSIFTRMISLNASLMKDWVKWQNITSDCVLFLKWYYITSNPTGTNVNVRW